MADAVGSLSVSRSRLRALWPLGPIFNKELREMARRKRSYWLRFGYLALLLSILGFTWIIMADSYRSYYQQNSIIVQAQRQAEMGKVFFGVFSVFSVCAMHLIGPVLTSTAIGSERLRRTFDVLLMTPISAWQLVCGKLFSRLLTALTLIGLTLPVLAIVRLLGGVELEDMFGIIALSTCVAISSAGIGLLLSCWIKRAWAVILLAYIIQGLIYGLFPMLVTVLVMQLSYGQSRFNSMWVMQWVAYANPLLTSAMKIEPPRGWISVSWTITSIVQLVITSVLMLLAANVVRRIGRREGSEGGNSKPALPPLAAAMPAPPSQTTGATPPPLPYASVNVRPIDTARSVGDNPVLWREWRRPLLPRLWMRIVAATMTIGLLLLSYLVFSIDGNILDDEEAHIGYAFVFHTLLLLMSVVLSATAVATEKESDTWTLLIVSPVSGTQVMWGKFIGVMRRMFWPWTIVLLHFAIFTLGGVVSIWSTLIVIGMTVSANAVWVATGLYLSLRLSKVTTAVVINLLLPILIYGLVPLALAAMEYGLGIMRGDDLAELTLYYIPYWYMGEGIDRLSSGTYNLHADALSGNRQVWLPFFNDRVHSVYMLLLTLVTTLVFLAITVLIVQLTAWRFDRYVKRA